MRLSELIACGGCTEVWTGSSAAHCAAADCHRTFSGPSAFDLHQPGECRHPADVGLVPRERSWGTAWGWSDRNGGILAGRLAGDLT
ncbi:FDXHR family putative zinc-binding protein [Nonomuraea maritima]